MSASSNDTQATLHGYLNSTHVSSIHADWTQQPTPWPWVVASVALSIVLGFFGVMASSYRSWGEPRHTRPSGIFSESLFSLSPNPAPYQLIHYRGLSTSSMATVSSHGERDGQQAYGGGGLGRFARITAVLGIGWSTVRAAAAVATMAQITRSGRDRHTYPGVATIVVLFTSVQTYLGSRAVPRLLYLLIIVDMCAIYAAMVLALLSFVKDKGTRYQEFSVLGGNCPCMLGLKAGKNNRMESCAGFGEKLVTAGSNFTRIGCDPAYLWTNSTNGDLAFPRSCLLSETGTGHDEVLDPNRMTYMVLAEIVVGGVGLLYGLVVLAIASRWVPQVLCRPSQLLQMMTLEDTHTHKHKQDRRYAGAQLYQSVQSHRPSLRTLIMTMSAFSALLAFAAVTTVVHVLDETGPSTVFYMDSFGELVNAGTNSTGTVGASWSDCFVVNTPVWTDGGFRQWWHITQNRILRALALV
ncbi:hypothetical protein PV08_06502 [Exophiala spinifera]|uniref:Uncharacterized protein n=1 Tax=Exophiala spinifera TaxID=91928 RepID=A0A0D2BYR5_9EURO|nr:uncharacterized protein PV08_06502 [Exophiala spinifera]KIW16449.1 hypothetical protein PV08_06502 [Exophiala spinifera]